MSYIYKVIVAIAVLAAGGYAFHRLQTCRVVFAPPPVANATATAPPKPVSAPPSAVATAAAPASLLYPSPAIEQSFKLGYATFQAEGQAGWQAVPLPPGKALQVLVAVAPSGQPALHLALPDDRCKSGVEVTAWHPDQDKPIANGVLAKGRQAMDIPLGDGMAPMVVGLRLPEGAANNWFCNVHASWKAP